VTTAELLAVKHGPAGLPKLTLGWAAMEWACEYLTQPDRPIAGQPWEFTEEQMRFVCWWYAINEAGKFRYTYGVLRRMKGWGKDPLMAVLAAIEFVGPCRFDGFDRNGEPLVVPQPSAWVQIAATSKEQTRNTMTLFPSLFSKRAVQEYSLDIGKEIIYAHKGKAQLQSVTSSPRTLEGARSTFVVLNETQHWMETNDGVEMAKAIRRNSAKVGGRGLAITNAHRIGENSVAEQDWLKYEQDGDAGEMLYDSLEAPDDTDINDDDSLRSGLLAARGDSVWVPIERLMIDMRDTRDPEVYRRRFYLNQIREESDTWITASEWAATERPEVVPENTQIAIGFDGSYVNDTTALVATTLATGYQWVVRYWERPKGVVGENWEVPEAEVNAAVAAAFDRYRVVRMYCDPYWWEQTIATWAGRYGKEIVAEVRTNRALTLMTQTLKAYETAVRTGELGHEANPAFAQHIANAVKRDVNIRDEDGERLYTIGKQSKGSSRKMDIAMAAVLSWGARNAAIASGALEESEQSMYNTDELFIL
jgi:hypothetical protein